jgi:hypothetical protein
MVVKYFMIYNFTGMLEYGNVGMMGNQNIGFGRGTRLRACGAEACATPNNILFQYSNIPLFL